jgi:uncharacterized protein
MTPSTTALRTHQFTALEPGPKLIVLGAVHGNEVGGTRGIERVLADMDAGKLQLVRGAVTFLPITNPLAYTKKQRMGERNLNRNLYPNTAPQDYEDRIANALCPLLSAHDVLLDLHSFHTAGQPFAMLGPQDNTDDLEPFAHAAKEEALARRLGPQRIVEGWLSTYADGVKKRLARTAPSERAHLLSIDPRYGVGTTEYMRTQGGWGITLECGQHDDPAAPEVAYQAIVATLAHLGLIDAPSPAPRDDIKLLKLMEVTDRLHADDTFAKPWASYDPLTRGELIGTRADGTAITAPQDGYIVFPNPTAVAGNEWFYFAQASARNLRA